MTDTASQREPGVRRPPGRPPCCTRELMVYVLTLREQGLSIRAIATRLNAESIPTPTGRLRWNHSNVDRLLATRFAQEVRQELMRRINPGTNEAPERPSRLG